jgi:hypothetical protein
MDKLLAETEFPFFMYGRLFLQAIATNTPQEKKVVRPCLKVATKEATFGQLAKRFFRRGVAVKSAVSLF